MYVKVSFIQPMFHLKPNPSPPRVADRGQDLGAGLLAAALDLGEVLHRDGGVPRHLGECAALLAPAAPQHLAEQGAQQRA
jgi:hypothetical protein